MVLMNTILILLLLLLGAALYLIKKHPTARPVAMILSVLVIGMVVYISFQKPVHPARNEELVFQQSAGYILGKSVAERFPDGGTFAVLTMPDFSSTTTLHMAKMMGLKNALPSGRYKLTELDLSAMPMSLQSFFEQLEGRNPIPEFWPLMAQVPDASGIISLVGFPPPPDATWSTFPVFAAVVVVLNRDYDKSSWPGLAAYVRVKPDQVIRQAPPSGASMSEVFSSRYELIVP
jgi:hypothetical protein